MWPAALLLLEDGAGLAVPPVVHQKAPPQAGRRRCRGRSSTRLCPSFRSLTPLSVLLLAVPPPGVRIRRAAYGRLPCCRSHLRAASVAGGPWVGRHRTTHYRSGHFLPLFCCSATVPAASRGAAPLRQPWHGAELRRHAERRRPHAHPRAAARQPGAVSCIAGGIAFGRDLYRDRGTCAHSFPDV